MNVIDTKLFVAENVQCACENEKKNPVYLRIRGLCPSSYIDTYVIPRNARGIEYMLG